MDYRRLQQGPHFGRRPGVRRFSAFTLIEILLAAFILLLMALMFAAVVPIATRGTHMSRSYSQAVMVAQRKIDDCQTYGYSVLEQTALPADASQPEYGLVDSPGTPFETVSGTRRYRFTNTDKLSTVFKGTGALAPEGILELNQNAIGGAGIKGQPSLMSVTVRIQWSEGANAKRTEYVISTLVTKMPMNK
jgi:type II secretory pathway pseudopilin PulG